MKVLHIFDHSIPLHSGYTFRSRSILNQQRALGIQTCHVTSPKHGNAVAGTETADDLLFYRSAQPSGIMTKLPGFNQLALVGPMTERILEVVALEKPDILHAHSPALNGLAALQASKKCGLPVVYEIRAFWEDAAVDHGSCKEGDLRYTLTRQLENYVVKRANAVTTICEGLRKDLVGRGFAANKLTVIPNAVNVEHFQMCGPKNAQLEAELGLTGCQVLGFLGSFYAYEGLDLAIAALASITQQAPDLRLLLVGGGPQEQQLRQLAQSLGVADKVIFTGRVPHQQIDNYYSLVDLLVYPRKSMRLTDLVTPLKPLEAMAQGKLVLASDVGGHHELITDGVNGYLFQADNVSAMADKIISLLSNRAQWPDVLQRGRHYVESERNWHNSVSNYLPLYQSLLK
ncbi:TIGR04063 family PEP-CTERM/XrtA system glycosyltransferase [Rheinheimera sp. F8]|uniref:TIGR04063 family PEP-CTERM/XrtA system glycosyltransferase n=1 Tax=Rheinheimera sp. F8 TaxID=1763998 RepID=UPI000744C035|nr:TIGR04063 family PEP-CTERM/XrtA system glycosyltransferase [Rheinheimera sp. F8]ALZ74994.1 glycosyltransferase WbuB [Rheinheimera sp. F8]ALZ76580.1 glycosyltransferase WbuB [Rheinheimera sp. F8]